MATGGGSKVQLRTIASLFNHLEPNVKAQITSAFSDAEDQLNFNNNSAVDSQERRAISGLVDAPVLKTTTNNRGFDVEWKRLNDQRISFYEINVSFDSIFSNPDDYTVVDTSFSLEGLGTTVFVRVRGVRFDGTCGPWSDTATIDAFATTAGPVVYTRGLDDIPNFYVIDISSVFPAPIQHLNITPQRQNGGIVVFGSLGVAGEDILFTPGDNITVKLNSTVLSTVDIGSLANTFTVNGNANYPFSTGFGPTFLTHEAFGFSAADDVFPNTATQTGSGSGTHTGWSNLANATGAMEVVFPGTFTDYQQKDMALGQSILTKTLKLTNFGFTVPAGNTISGIEVTFTGNWSPINIDPAKSTQFLHTIKLIDNTGTTRPTSQVSNFPWPYTNVTANGDPIPFVTVGGATNLWNESAGFWTPAQVNSANFGVEVVGNMHVASNDAVAASFIKIGDSVGADIQLYGMTMTVFSFNAAFEARIDVFYQVASGSGEITNCTLNAIEFGSAIT